jgi:cell wall-associated NlpC family hydrolase
MCEPKLSTQNSKLLSSEVSTKVGITHNCADADIVREARSWIGTRWVHGQAVKGHGTDCVGFIIQLGKTFQWIPQDYTPPVYSCQHALHRDTSLLLEELAKFALRVDRSVFDPALNSKLITNNSKLSPSIGSILAFQYERTAGHAGIYIGNDRFVHAYMPRRRVEEASLKDFRRYLNSVWRPKLILTSYVQTSAASVRPTSYGSPEAICK